MLRTTPSLRLAALACASLLLAMPAAAATLVFSHAGCSDPASAPADPRLENWALLGLEAPGAVGPACGDAGVDAWEISDPDPALAGPHYRHDASAVAGAADGWTLRARVSVRDLADTVDGSAVLEASAAGRRFRLLFGSDALGNTLVRRDGDTADLIAQAPAFEATGYHLYELAWNPTAGLAGQADLFVDGLPASLDWDGAPALEAQVLFGADDAAGTGAVRFSDLSFETGVQACRNGIDDDADGRIDLVLDDEDPGCDSPSDPSEKSVLRVCDDGLDNDGDGLVDRADPQCTSVTGRSERPGVAIVKTSEADWAAAAGGKTLVFDTSAANVGLADELGAPPAPGAFLCGPPSAPVASCVLHYAAVNTHLCRDFTLRAREVGAGITFDDSAERSGSAAWQNALSIGELGDHYNDDFEFAFGAGEPVHAFGFTFIDNQRKVVEGLYVYGPGDELLAVLPGPAAPVSDGNRSGFVGIVSPVPISRVFFDEDPDGDDLAIRDFRFGDPDPDADGLGDCAEAGLGTDPGLADSDADGLADGAEVTTHGTSPTDADSDDDALSDGAEVATHGTDPLDADSDDDGLSDGPELSVHATNPLDADSDDDGIPDGAEVEITGTSPTDADSDDDGLSDGAEVSLHGTNPKHADSDADGLGDGAEVNTYGTSPTHTDSDEDGLGDGVEVSTHGTNPANADSDSDGLSDGVEVNTTATDPLDADGDDDGLSDGAEVNTHGTSPTNPDSDGDGLGDGAELGTHGTDPLLADSDEDGLSDGAEVLVHGTNPLAADSDGDQADDAAEIAAGTDPNDPESFPVTPVPTMGELGRLLAAALVGLIGLRGGRRFRAARA